MGHRIVYFTPSYWRALEVMGQYAADQPGCFDIGGDEGAGYYVYAI